MTSLTFDHITQPSVYRFNGFDFEVHYWSGPWPLRQDGAPRKRAGARFWNTWQEFLKLSGPEQARHHIGGAKPVPLSVPHIAKVTDN